MTTLTRTFQPITRHRRRTVKAVKAETKILQCLNCGNAFTPDDEWQTCPVCMFNHCEMCGHCWDGADTDICSECNPQDEETFESGMERRSIPGTSLTYWA